LPKNIHNTIFATSVQGCDNIRPYKKRQHKNNKLSNEPSPTLEEESPLEISSKSLLCDA
jgi:hypothetical protein